VLLPAQADDPALLLSGLAVVPAAAACGQGRYRAWAPREAGIRDASGPARGSVRGALPAAARHPSGAGGMVTAIVAAAGRGRRFGAAENKVFALLGGQSVLHRSLSALSRCPEIGGLVVVTGAEDMERVRAIASAFEKTHAVCEGGAERYDSVWNA